jgi:hypothetical protein
MTQPLSWGQLLAILVATCQDLPDQRTGKNRQHTIRDAALGAFGVFFTQTPLFLARQRDMQRRKGCNNAQSLCGVAQSPSDPQIRNLLDPIAPAYLRPPFWAVRQRLAAIGALKDYHSFNGGLLCSLDGTQYFSSTQVHCAQCTVIEKETGTRHAHTVLIPALVRPGQAEVLGMEPEFIMPQDGAEKQDCERNAARRWIARIALRLAAQRVTILADDLHCHQPFCELLQAQHLSFILTGKPDSQPTLYEEVALLAQIGAVTQVSDRRWTGQGYEVWTYRYVNQVPLRAGPKALAVNWCALTIVGETTGEVLYHNAWATDYQLTADTIRPLVAAGRSRWKIEPENNNVLKNQGYHLEHNYGHSQQYLAAVVVLLILLAFLLHTVLQLCDEKYRRLRTALGTRRTFFDDIRALTRYHYFRGWEQLLAFMLAGLELTPG